MATVACLLDDRTEMGYFARARASEGSVNVFTWEPAARESVT